MKEESKKEITRISQQFFSGFKGTVDEINGSGWLVTDPLSGFLNSIGFENTLKELPEEDGRPQVLIMTFKDGSQFIPAGADLKPICKEAENWMWL